MGLNTEQLVINCTEIDCTVGRAYTCPSSTKALQWI